MEKKQIKNSEYYKLVCPRLTILITTIDEKGRPNVAPFSFISPVSFDPPLIMTSMAPNKKSYWNITATNEFVINIPGEKLLEKVWKSGTIRYGKSKTKQVGLDFAESRVVKSPSLADATANIECYLEWSRNAGDHVIMVGRIVNCRVDKNALDEENTLDVEKIRPLMHLSGKKFATPGKIVKVGEN